MVPSQNHFLSLFNEQHREPFNKELFERSDEKIIDELLKIIFSCQRNQNNFTFIVKSYRVVDNYDEIQTIMYDYEESTRKGKTKKKVNRYDYIDLKQTDIKLILVNYYIKVGEEELDLPVIIQVPRVVNKYYFRIAGNLYSALYQIVDGSTYNNSNSKNSKCANICFKVPFMPIRVYKSEYTLKTFGDENIPVINYSIQTFNKIFSAFKYILAKIGLYDTFTYMNVNMISIRKDVPDDDKLYVFRTNNKGIFISVPKFVFDAEPIIQSLVCSICISINKHTKYESIFTREYWLEMLGMEFGNATVVKGESLLSSLEGVYDISTKEKLRLPDDKKATIYDVIRWMCCEFPILNTKDNLDISTKSVGYAEYIASIWAMKMATIVHSLTDMVAKNKLKMDSVKKKMRGLKPSFLIDQLAKCQLVAYRNLVNDLDALIALKYTYKRLSGVGNNSTSTSVPAICKTIHPSHLGRVDLDSSSKSDPGLSGILCPMVELHNGSFTEYDEPNTWDGQFNKLIDEYHQLEGLKQVYVAREQMLGENHNNMISSVQCSLDIMKALVQPIKSVECTTRYLDMIKPLEDSGLIYIDYTGNSDTEGGYYIGR